MAIRPFPTGLPRGSVLAMTGQRLASLGWRSTPTRPTCCRCHAAMRHARPNGDAGRPDRTGRRRRRHPGARRRRRTEPMPWPRSSCASSAACCRRRCCVPGERAGRRRGDGAARRRQRLSPALGGDAAPGERGTGAARRRRGRAHRVVSAGRRRPGAVSRSWSASPSSWRHPWPGCIPNASPATSWARCAATAATSCAAPSAGWRMKVAAFCSTWPRRAAASGSPTSCAPTCCRTAGWIRSRPTITWASAATSAISGRRRRCCASSASARVRLLTNNPAKIAQLEQYGIEVVGPRAARLRGQRPQPALPAAPRRSAAATCSPSTIRSPRRGTVPSG